MAANQPTPDFDDELLSAYVDDELTPAERAAVEERLRTDERARRTLAELQRAAEALRALPPRRLGRDLSANIWAAIDAQQSQALDNERAGVLTLPAGSAEKSSGKGRGLLWAALAIAAAIMLMVLRPGAELGDRGAVAKQETKRNAGAKDAEQSGAAAPKELRRDSRESANVESTAVDAGRTAAATPKLDDGESQRPVVPPIERSLGASDRGEPIPAGARSREVGLAAGALPANQAAAPAAMPSVAASARTGAGPAKVTAESGLVATGSTVADAASQPVARTIEVVVPGGVEEFEQLLREHRITLVAAADEQTSRDATSSLVDDAAEAKATSGTESRGAAVAPRDGAAPGAADERSTPVAIVVEASPAALAEVLAALEPRSDRRYGLSRRPAEEERLAESAAGAGGAMSATAAAEDGDDANNRAWRVPASLYFHESQPLADLAAAGSAAQPATSAAAPSAPAGGRGGDVAGGVGGVVDRLGADFFDAGAARERVLFIVRPE